MLCEDIMKKNVHWVAPDSSVRTAAEKMRDENIGFLPVCDESRKIVGTLTDRDLTIRALASDLKGETPVQDVMTKEVVTCSLSDDVKTAQTVMAEHKKSRIICVDAGGGLAGVISLSDLGQHDPSSRTARTLRDVSQREARS